jgi:hypothetical protein
MAGSQIATSVTILNSLLGYTGISLTNMENSDAPQIAAGSKVEVAGAFFTFSADETIDASTWSAITTGESAYIKLVPTGTPGSQVLSAEWSEDAPVWSTSKQGWYASVGSSVRYVGGCWKSATAEYNTKFLMRNHGYEQESGGGFVPRKGIRGVNSILGNPISEASVFTAMGHFIPNVGDQMWVRGEIGTIHTLYAERTGASTLSIQRADSRSVFTFSEGGSATSAIYLCW